MSTSDPPVSEDRAHYVRPVDEELSFAELKDAPPAQRFRLSLPGRIGTVIVLIWIAIAIIGPFIAPYGENELPFPDDYSEFQAPRAGAWLGTDVADRDVLSRLIYGSGRKTGISVAAALLAYFLGVVLGIGVVVAGPRVDMVISRINDALISLPTIMLGLIAVAAFGSSTVVLIMAAGLIYMSIVFRLARAIGLEIFVMDYVKVAQLRGEGVWWIVRHEIWPNAAMPLISDFGLRLIYVILFVSSLGFLGLGVQPPSADLGTMVRENLAALQFGESVLPVVAPAFAIATMTVSINLIVDDVSTMAGGKLSGRM